MKRYVLSALLLFCTICHAQYAPKVLALTHVTLIDAGHRTPLANQTVIVKNGLIVSLFSTGSQMVPDSATVINLNGKYLLPGLIDSHVHMATDPSGVDNRAHTLDVLQRMLYSGVTTVRDMAGDARVLAALSRDAKLGEIVSPDIYYSALMAGAVFFSDPRTATSTKGGVNGDMPYMQAITDSTDIKLAIARAKGSGASGIKLYANLSAKQVGQIIAEADRQHFPVWGHAWLQGAKPSDLIEAGILSVSHAPLLLREKVPQIPAAWKSGKHSATFWDSATPNLDSVFTLMKQHHTILDATLLTYKIWAQTDSTVSWDYEIGRRLTSRAYKAGVIICAGTDDDQEQFVQAEIQVLIKDAGLSPIDAIVAATQNSAEAINLGGRKGLIKPGMDADFLILDANPLDNIDNIKKAYLVVKGGRIYGK